MGSEKKGLGGAMKFLFRCDGCWQETIDYQSSQLALDSRRHMVSLALSLAFFISGDVVMLLIEKPWVKVWVWVFCQTSHF